MDRENQIEKMASDINDCITEFITDTGDVYIDDEATAQKMFDKGYRKQIEGKWLIEGDMFKEYVCSRCGYSVDFPYQKTPFCPNCGAKMKGGE